MKALDQMTDSDIQDYYGELTALSLKARFYDRYPDEIYAPYCPVEAVHNEWANLGEAGTKAQIDILTAIGRLDWGEAEWLEYRKTQSIALTKRAAVIARIKREAAARTASLAK